MRPTHRSTTVCEELLADAKTQSTHMSTDEGPLRVQLYRVYASASRQREWFRVHAANVSALAGEAEALRRRFFPNEHGPLTAPREDTVNMATASDRSAHGFVGAAGDETFPGGIDRAGLLHNNDAAQVMNRRGSPSSPPRVCAWGPSSQETNADFNLPFCDAMGDAARDPTAVLSAASAVGVYNCDDVAVLRHLVPEYLLQLSPDWIHERLGGGTGGRRRGRERGVEISVDEVTSALVALLLPLLRAFRDVVDAVRCCLAWMRNAATSDGTLRINIFRATSRHLFYLLHEVLCCLSSWEAGESQFCMTSAVHKMSTEERSEATQIFRYILCANGGRALVLQLLCTDNNSYNDTPCHTDERITAPLTTTTTTNNTHFDGVADNPISPSIMPEVKEEEEVFKEPAEAEHGARASRNVSFASDSVLSVASSRVDFLSRFGRTSMHVDRNLRDNPGDIKRMVIYKQTKYERVNTFNRFVTFLLCLLVPLVFCLALSLGSTEWFLVSNFAYYRSLGIFFACRDGVVGLCLNSGSSKYTRRLTGRVSGETICEVSDSVVESYILPMWFLTLIQSICIILIIIVTLRIAGRPTRSHATIVVVCLLFVGLLCGVVNCVLFHYYTQCDRRECETSHYAAPDCKVEYAWGFSVYIAAICFNFCACIVSVCLWSYPHSLRAKSSQRYEEERRRKKDRHAHKTRGGIHVNRLLRPIRGELEEPSYLTAGDLGKNIPGADDWVYDDRNDLFYSFELDMFWDPRTEAYYNRGLDTWQTKVHGVVGTHRPSENVTDQ